MKSKVVPALLTMILIFGFTFIAQAEDIDWPKENITLTICYGAGGTTDISSRYVANFMEKEWGVKVVCENKPGGGGITTASLNSQKKPDGYSLCSIPASPLTIAPHRQKLPYDPMKDITLIAQYAYWNFAVAVKTNSPFESFSDIIEYARKNPGKLSYGVSGAGNTQHLLMEMLFDQEGVDVVGVPFKSGAEAVAATLGGHIDFMAGVSEWLPSVRSGDMKLIVCLDAQRMEEFPEIPSILELGYKSYAAANFLGIAAPPGVDPRIVKKIQDTVEKVCKDPGFIALMNKIQFPIKFRGHEEWTEFTKKTYEEMKSAIDKAGLGIQK